MLRQKNSKKVPGKFLQHSDNEKSLTTFCRLPRPTDKSSEYHCLRHCHVHCERKRSPRFNMYSIVCPSCSLVGHVARNTARLSQRYGTLLLPPIGFQSFNWGKKFGDWDRGVSKCIERQTRGRTRPDSCLLKAWTFDLQIENFYRISVDRVQCQVPFKIRNLSPPLLHFEDLTPPSRSPTNCHTTPTVWGCLRMSHPL